MKHGQLCKCALCEDLRSIVRDHPRRIREIQEETARLELQLKLMRGEVIELTDNDRVLLAQPVEPLDGLN
jgi:hypothetical protein